MVTGHFSVHRGQFSVDFGGRGLVARLRHCINAFAMVRGRTRRPKTDPFDNLVSQDRARTLISELSQGGLETKIGPKRVLEGRTTTSFARVVRRSSRRPTQSLGSAPNSKNWPRFDKMSTSRWLKKSTISGDIHRVVDCHHLRLSRGLWCFPRLCGQFLLVFHEALVKIPKSDCKKR